MKTVLLVIGLVKTDKLVSTDTYDRRCATQIAKDICKITDTCGEEKF